ncbi:MAG: von Willebrand factor type A domain-containing protein, partial [Rhodopirellula sp. JB044]|uniref:vWA domain-containing protein n=1 Tax=Rhodopirellula sp. JB044 TaxID=3342844 RepID=UPI00370A6292
SLAEARRPAAKVNAPANKSLLASDGGSATEGRRGVEKPQPMAMDMEPMSTSAATAERRVVEADSMSMMEMGMEADADMAMAMDADMMMSDDAMDMSMGMDMGMGMEMERASGMAESKSLSASKQSESSRGRAERAKSKAAELGQSRSGPVLSKEPFVKPQPSSASQGVLPGRYGLPTDVTVARERKRSSDQGRPVGEAITDLLDVLEGPSSADRVLGLGTGPGMSGDKFSPIRENEFKRVTEHPLSTLSIDVDTASYAKVRSYLQRNQLPRPDSVRIEEMVNYFDYDYTGPISIDGESTDPFAAAMTATVCPWEPKHRLVRVGLQAKTLTDTERPRCNLVFLIDTSGSMSSANKLPLVVDGMKVLLDELDEEDQVAIVVYAGSAGLVLDSTPVKDRRKIRRALTQLRSGGSTNGGAGLQLAYDTAREHFLKDGVNRVILCSDGDFNVGMTGTDQLVREARRQAKSGIDLTVLGFGMGNHNDAMMEKISNDAEGNYAFVDTIAEARKVLSDQLAGTLVTVAKDVKIQIEFNPAAVSSYRLIGYENRLLAKEDFNDDTKDAGEIGAGHRVTAFYEVVPAGRLPDAVAPAVDPLKYQPEKNQAVDEAPESDAGAEQDSDEVATDEVATANEMLTLKLRYKPPQGDTSRLMTRVLEDSKVPFSESDEDFRFAASVAAFGMLLRGSEFSGAWTYDDVLRAAENATGEDPHGLRSELLELVQTARRLTVRE